MEKLWTTSEVARHLNINETDVEQLIRDGKLIGYKLGGKFLRFRPEQVEGLKGLVKPGAQGTVEPQVPVEALPRRVRDLLYFYDFYILSFVLLVGLILYFITSG